MNSNQSLRNEAVKIIYHFEKMKHLNQYINIRKGKSIVKATDETIHQIVKDELDHFGHSADLNHIDVSEVTNMDSLFSCYGTDLGQTYNDLNPDISKWDVSKVENMYAMFWRCENFNSDISQWDVSNVENMYAMFNGCERFNQDLSQWDVSNVEDMYSMFEGCSKFNQDLSGWNVNKVKARGYIFDNCPIKEEFKPKFK